VRRTIKCDGIYEDLVRVTGREYGRVSTKPKGEDVQLCLPTVTTPKILEDYAYCK